MWWFVGIYFSQLGSEVKEYIMSISVLTTIERWNLEMCVPCVCVCVMRQEIHTFINKDYLTAMFR